MQFKLHINSCDDGSVIARCLRKLADQLDGQKLTHGLTRTIEEQGAVGYATFKDSRLMIENSQTGEENE